MQNSRTLLVVEGLAVWDAMQQKWQPFGKKRPASKEAGKSNREVYRP